MIQGTSDELKTPNRTMKYKICQRYEILSLSRWRFVGRGLVLVCTHTIQVAGAFGRVGYSGSCFLLCWLKVDVLMAIRDKP